MININKKISTIYSIKNSEFNTYADINVEFGEQMAKVLINSDFGVFGYNWFHTGKNPKKFLTEIDFHYTMRKFVGDSLYELDVEKTISKIKKNILYLRRNLEINKLEARECFDILKNNDFYDLDSIYTNFLNNEIFNIILPDLDYPKKNCKKYENFWNQLWIPFCDFLKNELEEI